MAIIQLASKALHGNTALNTSFPDPHQKDEYLSKQVLLKFPASID